MDSLIHSPEIGITGII